MLIIGAFYKVFFDGKFHICKLTDHDNTDMVFKYHGQLITLDRKFTKIILLGKPSPTLIKLY